MFLAAVAFAQLLRDCAPNIGTRTMTAIVRVESGGNPNALHDNTLRRTFRPVDAREATAWASQLLSAHHNVDLGLSQINGANLARLGMSVADAFEPCANLHGGATILSFDYRAAVAQFGIGQYALRRAIGAYNSGSIFEGNTYVSEILAAAGVTAATDFQVPDVGPLPYARAFSAQRAGGARPAAVVRGRENPEPQSQPQSSSLLTPFNSPLLVTSGIAVASTPAPLRGSPTVATTATSAPPVASLMSLAPTRSGILVPLPVSSPAPAVSPPSSTPLTKP